MKKMKKLLAFSLALVMLCAMAAPVMAAEGGPDTKGKITISNAKQGQEYKIYKIFDLESFSTNTPSNDDENTTHDTSGAYSYKVVTAWESFVQTGGAGASYVTIADGYVKWNTNANAADFAKAAIKFATDNSIAATETETATADGDLVFDNLELGYYLVESTTGALCSLDTTNTDVTIKDKNVAPTIEKKIVADTQKVESNTASINDTVSYQIKATVQPGGTNYIIHDIMGAGLVLANGANFTLKEKTEDGSNLANTNYNIVRTDLDDGCKFHITFTDQYLATLTQATDVYISYSVTVDKGITNEKINSTGKQPDVGDNIAWMEYGQDLETTPKKVTTSSYAFGLMKTKVDGKILNNAKFRLYNSLNGGNEIPVVEKEAATNTYRVAEPGETGVDIVAGNVVIDGLGNGTYYLEEKEAPNGYNKLSSREAVTIDGMDNLVLTSGKDDEEAYTSGGVRVINKTGTELPETGGIGTTIFYLVGGILAVGAGVILITKRRMNNR